ncbi:two-component hybrid sensor and regulator [Calothrix sp. NIES-4071]|nr:two-component hybrid sensor and regulator [Calothrix sp. NIES-4071]BAZ63186.1 two-component hybrid sensor and regulator [Calothrix sp. NIES-4105]
MTLASDSDLRFNLEPHEVLYSINDRIRRLLELPDILKAAVEELRIFLATDRVMVYKFHADGNGQVIAESINENKLPSLLNLNFPADDIPSHARELFIKSRVRSIVNVDTRQIAQNAVAFNGMSSHRPVDPCHIEYLTAMGVQSSIVVPILYHEKLWGLLVSHHSQPRTISNAEVDTVQIVADLLALAVAYITPLQDVRLKAHRETIINRIADRLHSLPDMDLQTALEETVAAFGGCGGRLCIRSEATYQVDTPQSFIECLTDNTRIEVYQFGKQPVVPKTAKYNLIEQYSVWEEYYKGDYGVWAISDIYQTPELRNVQVAFQGTNIRSILMIPLLYRSQLQGYLSIFCDSYDSETLWAGELNPDERQLYPRQSFEIWRSIKQRQAKQWTREEIALATSIGHQFATATYEYELYQKVNYFNLNLESQVRKRTSELTTTLEELQKTQTQLIQTEKMSSLGQLVAGIAHEINNPVNFIYGNINHVNEYINDIISILDLYQQNCSCQIPEVIERAQEVDLDFIVEDLPKMLSSIKLGTDRIRQIVLSLRNFSRLDQAEIKPVNIHEGIDSTLVILQHRLKAKPESPAINIIKEYGDLPLVECYAGQINQVFMNVLSNAIDALEDLSVKSEQTQQNRISITTNVSKLPDNRPSVLISIADNGCGMPQNVLKKIFDPFFTTKQVGQGTGLGLSISYQIIVDKHNGTFKCESHPGEGTEFLIEIPIKV